jgi:mannose-6-phosphate isomerase-like protein (cupin superfamily)
MQGRFRMDFRDREEWIEQGEFLIVPHGVEHRPVAEEEVHVLLFEPAATLNTGNVHGERTGSGYRARYRSMSGSCSIPTAYPNCSGPSPIRA